jgi:hypothetical protein
MVKKTVDIDQFTIYNDTMNRELITKLAHEYLDNPMNPNWDGLYSALLRNGCNLYEVQDILLSIKNGEY